MGVLQWFSFLFLLLLILACQHGDISATLYCSVDNVVRDSRYSFGCWLDIEPFISAIGLKQEVCRYVKCDGRTLGWAEDLCQRNGIQLANHVQSKLLFFFLAKRHFYQFTIAIVMQY